MMGRTTANDRESHSLESVRQSKQSSTENPGTVLDMQLVLLCPGKGREHTQMVRNEWVKW
jgi:hypothetical protein